MGIKHAVIKDTSAAANDVVDGNVKLRFFSSSKLCVTELMLENKNFSILTLAGQ